MPEIQLSNLGPHDRFGIVASRYNESITTHLLNGAIETLKENGVGEDHIDIARVPGAWELPIVAQRMAHAGSYSAVICLGAVIQGETTHDRHLNHAVSIALSNLALDHNCPILFGLLTCQTLEQAIQRAGGNVGNKGSECAEGAIEMVRLLKSLPNRA